MIQDLRFADAKALDILRADLLSAVRLIVSLFLVVKGPYMIIHIVDNLKEMLLSQIQYLQFNCPFRQSVLLMQKK